MLNKEKYKEKIWDYILKHGQMPAITKGGFKSCQTVHCCNDGCVFYRAHLTCEEGLIEWLNSEYKEPETNWTKVPVDTAVIVSNDEETWYNRYFARYKNNKVNTWSFGNTSWSAEDGSDFVSWAYAKLANEEDVQKYRKE